MQAELEPLINCIGNSLEDTISSFYAGKNISALGLRRSAHLPVLMALYTKMKRPVLLITDRSDRALGLVEELALWSPDVDALIFPEPTPLFYENTAWDQNTKRDRLAALSVLAINDKPDKKKSLSVPIIISPARALMTRTIPPTEFINSTCSLYPGLLFPINEFSRYCFRLGFENVYTVISPGQFTYRGGIFDLWPPTEIRPIRLEFFGNEIETIRRFDPSSQRTIRDPVESEIGSILLTPAREFILPDEERFYSGDEDYTEFNIPQIYQDSGSLLDYLPEESLILIDDMQAVKDSIDEIENQAVQLRAENIKEEVIAKDFPIPYFSWIEIMESIDLHQFIVLGLPLTSELDNHDNVSGKNEHGPGHLAQFFTPGLRFGGRVKQVMQYLQEISGLEQESIIISRQSARLEGLWNETRQDEQIHGPIFIEGSLTEGWTFTPAGCSPIHLLTDGEIFGWRRPEIRQRARPIAEAPETPYEDLELNQWVVHIDHGIGRFLGLVQRNVDGLEREYLSIEYADEAILFVPVHQADRITRYIGSDSHPPLPSHLGGVDWKNTKNKVKEGVSEVAKDLLHLYAQRSNVEGFAFSADNEWQHELEASFPYIETPDQTRVLWEVKSDMQTMRPMDRLICGDVGYGKTEVALRAAFKAVLDGKQVAILVPTTVLAQQHYNTFRQRLSAFPVNVEMLSRFRNLNQQRQILKGLEAGNIDIVIGTHRLLSSDVGFKDMGLLIIDEEQRFGVTHKEAFKKMRTEVDVLTLTATPIPRTLYMALSGIRDISTINTPPEERLPVITHVGPYSQKLIRQAIIRELERGGQVFFVHNRVQTINAMLNHLQHLVPEARFGVAHGQMLENELSEVMEIFTNGEIDVLLTTSIIESGLDIPNANTLIVDRADTFGLAQLYQLRGRVGRGAQRAYAYFFRHNRKLPTQEGRQRLETIAENTALGAGFSIAMRDLEIRGAGDIIGTRQHGHIAAVGFYLYTRLLSEAVARLRNGKEFPEGQKIYNAGFNTSPINIDLPLPISIPADYVSVKENRLALYRRIADLQTKAEIEAIEEELIDRFGSIPVLVKNLLFQVRIKLLGITKGVSSITVEHDQIVLRFPDDTIPPELPFLGQYIRTGKTALWMPYRKVPDWQPELIEVLEKLPVRNNS